MKYRKMKLWIFLVVLILSKTNQFILKLFDEVFLKGNEMQRIEALLNSDQSKMWVINEQFINLWFLVPSSEQLCEDME